MAAQMEKAQPAGVSGVGNLSEISFLVAPSQPRLLATFTTMKPAYTSAVSTRSCSAGTWLRAGRGGAAKACVSFFPGAQEKGSKRAARAVGGGGAAPRRAGGAGGRPVFPSCSCSSKRHQVAPPHVGVPSRELAPISRSQGAPRL